MLRGVAFRVAFRRKSNLVGGRDITAPALHFHNSGAVFKVVTVVEPTEACTSHAFEVCRRLLREPRETADAA